MEHQQQSAMPIGLCSRRRSVVLFGDSLTQRSYDEGGWGASLSHHLLRRADVYNRGYGGYNTRWALHLLPQLFPAQEGGHWLVTVFFGANDATIPSQAPHVPLDEYEANLKQILNYLKTKAQHVVLIAPPGLNESQRLQFQVEQYKELATGQLERFNATQSKYADACVRVGQEVGAPTLDLRTLQKRADWPELQMDGLHMSRTGQIAIWHELRPLIDSLLGPVQDLPMDYPIGQDMRQEGWKDIIGSHLEQTSICPQTRWK